MHAAQVTTWGSPPTYISVPSTPTPSANETPITLLATGIHRVVRSRASGNHYTSTTLPHDPGIDGVGSTPDGKLVYFSSIGISSGSFAETINVPNSAIWPLPKGVDPVKVAAGVNPGMSSWMAMQARCQDLPEGFSVLVMGVTSASGRMAVGLAKALWAGRIVGVARNEGAMHDIHGFDEKIVLRDPVTETEFEKVGHVDMVLDYLYGPATEQLFKGMAKWQRGKRTQYLQIGSLAGPETRLDGSLLRSKDLVMRGSGPGSWTMQELGKDMPKLLEAIVALEGGKVRVEKLADVERVWGEKEDSRRVVFVP